MKGLFWIFALCLYVFGQEAVEFSVRAPANGVMTIYPDEEGGSIVRHYMTNNQNVNNGEDIPVVVLLPGLGLSA